MYLETKFKKHTLEVVAAIIEQINQHPADVKTTNQYALETNINRKKLQAAFKHVTGVGLQEYRLIRRMNFARQLLQEGQKPIKEIAIICRFKSQRAFTTSFKNAFGVTPLEYQKINT